MRGQYFANSISHSNARENNAKIDEVKEEKTREKEKQASTERKEDAALHLVQIQLSHFYDEMDSQNKSFMTWHLL